MTAPALVVGGGVAGCAAAVAAAAAGSPVVLVEARRHLGGVAARGEHRTLCGLAPIDAARPELLEAALTAAWVEALATGAPFRQGRVWLWPTDPAALQAGLARRLSAAGVEVRPGATVTGIAIDEGRVAAASIDGQRMEVRSLIDAGGGALAARLLGAPVAAAEQWPAHRSVLRLPGLGPGRADRVKALAAAQRAVGGTAAIALTPLGADRWQLSLDVAPGSAAAAAAGLAGRVAAVLGGEVLACGIAVAERDGGRAGSVLGLAEVFAMRDRGLCWAAWPREAHGAGGVAWTWPAHDRHGVPPAAAQPAWAPSNLWLAGKALAVDAAAAAALRVTGTGLAVGGAVGALAGRA